MTAHATNLRSTRGEQVVDTFTPWFVFVLAVLATWRITHLVAEEDGPFDSILKLRSILGTSTFGALMDCFECVSLLIAIPLAFLVGHSPLGGVLAWLAISGAACLLERLGARRTDLPLQPLSFPENHDCDSQRSRPDCRET